MHERSLQAMGHLQRMNMACPHCSRMTIAWWKKWHRTLYKPVRCPECGQDAAEQAWVNIVNGPLLFLLLIPTTLLWSLRQQSIWPGLGGLAAWLILEGLILFKTPLRPVESVHRELVTRQISSIGPKVFIIIVSGMLYAVIKWWLSG